MTDLDHVGVPGASVTASGPGGGTSAVQAGSGFYSINVTTGDYLVVPSGVPAGAGDAQYKPRHARVSVPPDGKASADFSLDTGLKVTLKLAHASVPADGMTVVMSGTLTTEYGKPSPTSASCWSQSRRMGYEAAVTTGARVAICNSYGGGYGLPARGRGGVADPQRQAVDLVTDQDGSYDFTLTVGTVPGPLNCRPGPRALDRRADHGRVAWDEQTLDPHGPGERQIRRVPCDAQRPNGTSQASKQAWGRWSTTPRASPKPWRSWDASRNMLGGLAFSMVNGSAGGPAVLVYDDDSPPTVEANGDVVAGGRTWVLSPGEWKGTAKIGGVLSAVIQTGKLQWAPTYTEWAKGTQVQGWSLSKSTPRSGRRTSSTTGGLTRATLQGRQPLAPATEPRSIPSRAARLGPSSEQLGCHTLAS